MFVKRILTGALLLALSGCATLPTGPSVLVLPSRGKALSEFQAEDGICRQWAGQQLGISAQDTANRNTVKGATLGTAIGAGAGALLGAASGNAGAGAAIGAGSGLLVGTAAGANAGEVYGWEAQRRYDHAYMQCMYAEVNQIPGRVQHNRVKRAIPPPPPPQMMVPPDYIP
ncbi:YMGG-like glycine zipper-containing protein [Geobacter sp. DSM 9736]|uniref:YMGG-like glycine zipper-containing protein n=1 Tax=Geobacter sp. DSM 9736 TaxID=1277350 RepID=UPI000B61046D|nr:YMGG-like glycine zipper-containing protein [Geobacter sp. DSM 9736]SNB47238.1 Glycine-zipper containing OmpA-like membrane domain-containing protein [Geobacter sp. DSM 9736]